MEVFEIKSTKDKLIITIDRSAVDARFLSNFVKRLRVEQLIRKANFDDDILELAEKIKKDWWKKIKKDF
ncbi:MAG: hypothetical protein ACRENG_12690 [bacterium]